MNILIARRIVPILWVPLLVLVAACDDGSPTSPSTSITGSWSLISVDGEAIPVVLIDTPTSKLEVLSGSVTLRSAARFTSTVTWRETVSGVATRTNDTVVGRFTLSNSTLRVSPVGESEIILTATMSAGNAQMTVVDDGRVLVFQRVAAAPPPASGG